MLHLLALWCVLVALPCLGQESPPPVHPQQPGQHPQQEEPPEPEPSYQFFSGTVAEFSDTAITVRRNLSGKAPERRKFIRNADTKISGVLKKDARVTVAYLTPDEGDLAVRVLVRTKK